MKKFLLIVSLLLVTLSAPVAARNKRHANNKAAQAATIKANRSDSIYKSVSQLYASGKISTDSLVNLALYHKAWSPELAERCLKLATDNNPRSMTELGVIYAFSPEFKKQSADGIKLLEAAANAGYDEANGYLGLYYFNRKDYKKALAYFDACRSMEQGFAYTALGSMYLEGKGVNEDLAKAREFYHLGALKGYPRGMALYGFNLRATAAGPVSYPDSFFWLYIAGDLGDDAARTTLYLPRRNENRGDSETAAKAVEALQWIEQVQTGKKIQNEPIYKDGFVPSLKAREQAAEQGDDWARFYLGSMNYNGDFLKQNYAQAIKYYESIAKNGKLPHTVLALVNERLAKMYAEGKGTKADAAKAARYARAAAHYGSLQAYKTVEKC